MSFIELSIILLISLGILDKDKLMKVYKFLTSNRQSTEIIGDKSINEKWVWIEQEQSVKKSFPITLRS